MNEPTSCYRTCPYCGVPLQRQKGKAWRMAIVCPDHADLVNLDPGFSNPRVIQTPVGVQPFLGASR